MGSSNFHWTPGKRLLSNLYKIWLRIYLLSNEKSIISGFVPITILWSFPTFFQLIIDRLIGLLNPEEFNNVYFTQASWTYFFHHFVKKLTFGAFGTPNRCRGHHRSGTSGTTTKRRKRIIASSVPSAKNKIFFFC